MKRLMSLLTWRRAFSLLGVLALIALIWFAGPYISVAGYVPLESPAVRLLLILLLIVCIGLVYLIKQIQITRSNNKIIEDLADSAAGKTPGAVRMDQSTEEVTLLKRRFDEALQILKQSRKNDGGSSLYSLPWYIIIGPPAAGKTTALLNSGLKFPLEDRIGSGELKGVGGTRNCDWLFTDQAVLLDTAGRYVTQDSHAAMDSAEWEAFLGLLKKHRRRRPVNGVLVAVNLVDLMQQNVQERDSHVRTIKKRIQELYKYFGIRLPVYVLLTKSDRVAGFTEFFNDLSREERAQVWGFTSSLLKEKEAPDIASIFSSEYDQLLARLNARVVHRLSQERDLKRRDLIFDFPRQMASLKEILGEFLSAVFQPNLYEEPIIFRGMYFTSGTQEGRPIDRLMLNMARTFGLDQHLLPSLGKQGRSYFITRLLSEVVFLEAGLAGYDTRFEKRRAWLQRGSYAGIMGITALAALGWFTSYTSNTAYVKQVAAGLNEYKQVAGNGKLAITDANEMLARLDALQAATKVAGRYESDVPFHMRLWLYQGTALYDAAEDAYIRDMNASFVPFIARQLEQQLTRPSSNPEFQYEALKTYLMLGHPDKMDSQQVSLWMNKYWQMQFSREPSKQARLLAHLKILLQGTIQPAVLDGRLIERVRGDLKRVSYSGLIYARLKREAMADDHSAFRVTEAVGPSARVVFTATHDPDLQEGIPMLFTQEGYYKFYLKQSKRLVDVLRAEDWVLADEHNTTNVKELERLDKDIGNLYATDYVKEWEGLLNDLKIVPFKNIQHATQVLEVMTGPAAPITHLLEAVAQNTMLSRLPEGAQSGIDRLDKASNLKVSGRWGDALPQDALSMPEALAGSQIEEHFQPLNSFVQLRGGQAPADKLKDLLSKLYGQLIAIEGGYADRTEGGQTDSGGLRNLLIDIDQEGTKQQEPVKGWMKQLTQNIQELWKHNKREKLNNIWNASIRNECEKALNGRYPFNKNAQLEVTIDDFGRFFSPNGKLDQFFQQQLRSLVDTTQPTWRWIAESDQANGLSNQALRQMQRAAAIREAFFQDGGDVPRVNFKIKPVYLDAKVKQFTLDLEGERFEYAFGPQITSNAQWPVPGGNSKVSIGFTDFNDLKHSNSKDGPWAWFKIMDQADKQRISPDRFIATFEVDGLKAKYEIRASSVINPFFMQDLEKFQCPREF